MQRRLEGAEEEKGKEIKVNLFLFFFKTRKMLSTTATTTPRRAFSASTPSSTSSASSFRNPGSISKHQKQQHNLKHAPSAPVSQRKKPTKPRPEFDTFVHDLSGMSLSPREQVCLLFRNIMYYTQSNSLSI